MWRLFNMLVNQGTITFDFNQELSLKELARQLVAFDTGDNNFASIRIMEIFHEQGKNRYVEGSISTKNLTESTKIEMSSTSIKSEYLFSNIMKTVSTISKSTSKYALVIYFMNKGFQYTYKNAFKLTTNPEIFPEQYNQDAIDQIIAVNEDINKIIDSYYADNTRDVTLAIDLFKDEVKDDFTPENKDAIADYGEYKLIDGQNSNIKKYFYSLCKDDDAFIHFSGKLDELRAEVKLYMYPEIATLREYFNISTDRYRAGRLDGLNLLVKTYGSTFCKKIVS